MAGDLTGAGSGFVHGPGGGTRTTPVEPLLQVLLAQVLPGLLQPGAERVAQQPMVQPIAEVRLYRLFRLALDGIGRGFLPPGGAAGPVELIVVVMAAIQQFKGELADGAGNDRVLSLYSRRVARGGRGRQSVTRRVSSSAGGLSGDTACLFDLSRGTAVSGSSSDESGWYNLPVSIAGGWRWQARVLQDYRYRERLDRAHPLIPTNGRAFRCLHGRGRSLMN
ncbi:MAG: hypothetical protein GAK45_00577 [Pseudomonas citronellolis]|nr:MAG: hypothetical protein GAK45_00577 [Pseudomonas citronellolis]